MSLSASFEIVENVFSNLASNLESPLSFRLLFDLLKSSVKTSRKLGSRGINRFHPNIDNNLMIRINREQRARREAEEAKLKKKSALASKHAISNH